MFFIHPVLSMLQKVRLTLKIDFPVEKLPDPAFRKELIANATSKAKSLFADGVNIDIEQAIEKGSKEEEALTTFSKEMTDTFHAKIPGSQVVKIKRIMISTEDEFQNLKILFYLQLNLQLSNIFLKVGKYTCDSNKQIQ